MTGFQWGTVVNAIALAALISLAAADDGDDRKMHSESPAKFGNDIRGEDLHQKLKKKEDNSALLTNDYSNKADFCNDKKRKQCDKLDKNELGNRKRQQKSKIAAGAEARKPRKGKNKFDEYCLDSEEFRCKNSRKEQAVARREKLMRKRKSWKKSAKKLELKRKKYMDNRGGGKLEEKFVKKEKFNWIQNEKRPTITENRWYDANTNGRSQYSAVASTTKLEDEDLSRKREIKDEKRKPFHREETKVLVKPDEPVAAKTDETPDRLQLHKMEEDIDEVTVETVEEAAASIEEDSPVEKRQQLVGWKVEEKDGVCTFQPDLVGLAEVKPLFGEQGFEKQESIRPAIPDGQISMTEGDLTLPKVRCDKETWSEKMSKKASYEEVLLGQTWAGGAECIRSGNS